MLELRGFNQSGQSDEERVSRNKSDGFNLISSLPTFLLLIPVDLRLTFETKRGNFKYCNEYWDVHVSTYKPFIFVSRAAEHKISSVISFSKLITTSPPKKGGGGVLKN